MWYWRAGGWGMWPMVPCLLAALWILGERAVYFALERVDEEALLGVVAALVRDGRLGDAVTWSLRAPNALGRLLAAGLARIEEGGAAALAAMDVVALREQPPEGVRRAQAPGHRVAEPARGATSPRLASAALRARRGATRAGGPRPRPGGRCTPPPSSGRSTRASPRAAGAAPATRRSWWWCWRPSGRSCGAASGDASVPRSAVERGGRNLSGCAHPARTSGCNLRPRSPIRRPEAPPRVVLLREDHHQRRRRVQPREVPRRRPAERVRRRHRDHPHHQPEVRAPGRAL